MTVINLMTEESFDKNLWFSTDGQRLELTYRLSPDDDATLISDIAEWAAGHGAELRSCDTLDLDLRPYLTPGNYRENDSRYLSDHPTGLVVLEGDTDQAATEAMLRFTDRVASDVSPGSHIQHRLQGLRGPPNRRCLSRGDGEVRRRVAAMRPLVSSPPRANHQPPGCDHPARGTAWGHHRAGVGAMTTIPAPMGPLTNLIVPIIDYFTRRIGIRFRVLRYRQDLFPTGHVPAGRTLFLEPFGKNNRDLLEVYQ